jgi:hypothetical protein
MAGKLIAPKIDRLLSVARAFTTLMQEIANAARRNRDHRSMPRVG